jgi:peptide deformylase
MFKQLMTIGEPVLRGQANPVTKFNNIRLQLVLRDMAETMYRENGVGLAAPQIGIRRRIVVLDVGEGLVELINPEIVSLEGEIGMVEGCLSVPGRRGFVVRPERVKVKAQDRKGEWFEIEGDGLLGRCLQHEIDHLDGILYVDKMDHEVFDEDMQEEQEA